MQAISFPPKNGTLHSKERPPIARVTLILIPGLKLEEAQHQSRTGWFFKLSWDQGKDEDTDEPQSGSGGSGLCQGCPAATQNNAVTCSSLQGKPSPREGEEGSAMEAGAGRHHREAASRTAQASAKQDEDQRGEDSLKNGLVPSRSKRYICKLN